VLGIKGVRKGDLGLNKNFITCAKEIKYFRILFVC